MLYIRIDVELLCLLLFSGVFVSITLIRSLSMQRLNPNCQLNGITKIAMFTFPLTRSFSYWTHLTLSQTLDYIHSTTAHTAHGSGSTHNHYYCKRSESLNNSNRMDNFFPRFLIYSSTRRCIFWIARRLSPGWCGNNVGAYEPYIAQTHRRWRNVPAKEDSIQFAFGFSVLNIGARINPEILCWDRCGAPFIVLSDGTDGLDSYAN